MRKSRFVTISSSRNKSLSYPNWSDGTDGQLKAIVNVITDAAPIAASRLESGDYQSPSSFCPSYSGPHAHRPTYRGAPAQRHAGLRMVRPHLHQAVLTVLHIGADHYGLDQLRYDLRKIKAHELLTGDGKLYAHPLTEKGTKDAFLFCSSTINPPPRVQTANSSSRSLHPQHHPTTRSGLKMLKYRHLRMMP